MSARRDGNARRAEDQKPMMRLRTLFLMTFLLVIVAGAYLLIKNRSLVDADGLTKPTDDAAPPANESRRVLAEGQFHNVAHTGAGTATIYQDGSGRRVLRFSEFETAPGPDLQVCLVAAVDAYDDATVRRAGFVFVAPLKGMIGDQDYELPANVDLTRYRAVTILSRRAAVNFTTAPLQAEENR